VVEPVGGDEGVPVDVRLVSTTQVDLADEVERGRFREDLYYRLAVVPLVVPPLRARLEDLPALCQHLIERLVREHGLPRRGLDESALERLRAHPWPGNVRELENTLERALVLAPAATGERGEGAALPDLRAEDLDFLERVTRGVAGELAERALAHGLTLEELEHAMLEAAFHQQRGNASGAARQVGLTRRAFEYRRSKSKGSE
jgi:DNA-binding NtrC family response regulator